MKFDKLRWRNWGLKYGGVQDGALKLCPCPTPAHSLNQQSGDQKASFGETQVKHFLGYWKQRTFWAFCVRTKMTLYDVRSLKHAWLSDAQKGEKPSMFLASDVIQRHFGAHIESQESSSLPVAKHFLGLCLAKTP